MTSYWTAALMTVEGPRKGEPSSKTMRHGLRTQPASLVRGSSRRIMSMRFRPAHISVINRRVSAQAVIGPAVQNLLKAHQQEHVPEGDKIKNQNPGLDKVAPYQFSEGVFSARSTMNASTGVFFISRFNPSY